MITRVTIPFWQWQKSVKNSWISIVIGIITKIGSFVASETSRSSKNLQEFVDSCLSYP